MTNTKFFGSEGLTMTSANHLANIAKEYVANYQAAINNISFVNEAVSVNGAEPIVTKIGINNPESIEDTLLKIAKFNSFIAYIREAIKAKNNLMEEIVSVNTWLKENHPEVVDFEFDHKEIDFNDAFAELSIKEQAEYFKLDAICATIGKAIHPNGAYHNARANMYDAMANPAKVSDTKITTYAPVAKGEDVDKVFFDLQKKHRESEARLNAMKHSLEKKVEDFNKAAAEEENAKYDAYTQERQKRINEYNLFAKEERARIAALKIVIPNDLKETYDFLSNL